MKKFFPFLILVLLLGIVFTPQPRYVYAATPAVFESTIQVMNLDTANAANIAIYYYLENGTLATLPAPYTNPVTDTIPAGVAATYAPIHAGAGFKGSVVISSDRPLASISNLSIVATNRALGTFSGVSSGAGTIFFPLVDKRNNVSILSIQNADTTAVDITVQFIKQPGSSYPDIPDQTATIQVGASKYYDMADFAGTSQWLGSVKVTATGGKLITGVLSNVNLVNPDSPLNAVYGSFAGGSTTVILPLIMEANSGNRTGTSCQNLGPGPATITMSYFPEAGYPARADDVFTDVPENGIAVKLMAETGTKWVGSSRVTVSGGATIACVVNQTRPSLRRSSIYEGFSTSGQTDTVVLPLIMSKNGTTTKSFTGFSVATVDGSSKSITCDWLPASGYPDIANTTLGPAPIVVFSQQTGFSPGDAKWVGSARCTSSDGTPIVAVVNQSREGMPTGTLRDVTSAYDGFNE